MQAFTILNSVMVPLDRSNVDTDAIIPKQYLKSIRRTGFGPFLFDDWRYLEPGDLSIDPASRAPNPEFVLNRPEYGGAKILLARKNFGCGSSREHAVWALLDYGFCCVIAPSFADIFFNNCFKNGVLPIVLSEQVIDELFSAAGLGLELTVALAAQTVSLPDGRSFEFQIDDYRKQRLLKGLDDIGETLQAAAQIRSFEARHKAAQPWLFNEKPQ